MHLEVQVQSDAYNAPADGGGRTEAENPAAPGEAGAKHHGSWERVGIERPFLNLNFSSKNTKTS